MEITKLGDNDVVLSYGICRCYVWPISFFDNVARCGRCHEAPDKLNTNIGHDEAVLIFHERYGRSIVPIG